MKLRLPDQLVVDTVEIGCRGLPSVRAERLSRAEERWETDDYDLNPGQGVRTPYAGKRRFVWDRNCEEKRG